MIGGILGHQVGSGRGQDVATGRRRGGAARCGANVGSQYGGQQTVTQDVQRCAYTSEQRTSGLLGRDVQLPGHEHRVQIDDAPGPTILVNDRGEPRV